MKFYLIVMTAILMSGTASAQKLNIGIKGGLNVYNIHHDNSLKSTQKPGFHAGLIGHMHLSKYLAIQPEAVYSTQGAEYRDNGTNTKFNLDYINVPFLFQLMFGNGFRIQAGPQVGFLINAKSHTNGTTIDHKDDFKSIDFAVAMGMSYVHQSGFGIDARYNLGLSRIYENSSANVTNRGFQLGLFYLFNHKT